MTHLAVITNRGSTRNLRGDNWIEPMLEAETDVTHFPIDSAGQVAETVRRCAEIGADVIVVNGGDGTAGLVFAALLNGDAYRTLPLLALLPAGKTNMTTAGWSLKGTPEAAFRAVLLARRAGDLAHYVVSRPVLALHRGTGAPPLYGAFFGAAEVLEGIRFCRKRIYPMGLPNAVSHTVAIAFLLWRGLYSNRSSGDITIHDGDRAVEDGAFFAVAVTALDEMMLGLRPMPAVLDAEPMPSPLHYMSMRKGPGAILGALWSLVRRRFAPGFGRAVQRLERVTLRFTGPYTLDGEIYEAGAAQPLVIDGTRRLNFIRIPP